MLVYAKTGVVTTKGLMFDDRGPMLFTIDKYYGRVNTVARAAASMWRIRQDELLEHPQPDTRKAYAKYWFNNMFFFPREFHDGYILRLDADECVVFGIEGTTMYKLIEESNYSEISQLFTSWVEAPPSPNKVYSVYVANQTPTFVKTITAPDVSHAIIDTIRIDREFKSVWRRYTYIRDVVIPKVIEKDGDYYIYSADLGVLVLTPKPVLTSISIEDTAALVDPSLFTAKV